MWEKVSLQGCQRQGIQITLLSHSLAWLFPPRLGGEGYYLYGGLPADHNISELASVASQSLDYTRVVILRRRPLRTLDTTSAPSGVDVPDLLRDPSLLLHCSEGLTTRCAYRHQAPGRLWNALLVWRQRVRHKSAASFFFGLLFRPPIFCDAAAPKGFQYVFGELRHLFKMP